MKKSFLNSKTPFVTEMIQVKTAELAKQKINKAILNGATAIGLQMSVLEEQFRTEETLSEIFNTAKEKPIYFTNYRDNLNEGKTDEELLEGLLFGLKCGATLLDVMGDTFDKSLEEYTTNPIAIEKQKKFIDKVHGLGGEVLMSVHVHQFRDAEWVLNVALGLQERGADIVKIVTGAQTQEQEIENLRICTILKENLNVPFLFLSGGEYSYLHRTIGPAIGVFSWLCFVEHDETTYAGPPLLADVLSIKKGLKL